MGRALADPAVAPLPGRSGGLCGGRGRCHVADMVGDSRHPVVYLPLVPALLCVAYVLGNREEVEKLEFESPAKLRIARAAAILADSPFLALTGPKTFGSFVRAISAFLLVGPGVAATSWKLFQSAIAGWRGSPEHVADVLKTLATVGVRVPLEELIRSDQTDRFVKTFQAVRLFDGVILRSSEPMGLVLADKLRNEILAIVPPTQGQPAPARPAARSSSAPVPARWSAPSQASPPQAAPKQTPPASPPVAPPKRRPPGRPA